MIGIFDSGFGGLTILQEIQKQLPKYNYLYFGDNANAPYGCRTPEEIYNLTKQGVIYLFENGCQLVILACNTASAQALRKLQQEFLHQNYPSNYRVLGIIVPTIEQIIDSQNIHKVGILGTTQTINAGSYQREIKKHRPDIQVFGQACPSLCGLIEDNSHSNLLDEHIIKYLSLLPEDLDAVLLGCTHYEIIASQIKKHLPAKTILFEQPKMVAKSLKNYLERHPEIEAKLEQNGQTTFITSAEPKLISQTASLFFNSEINFKKI